MKLVVFIAVSVLCLVVLNQLSPTMSESETEFEESVIFRFSCVEKQISDQRFRWVKVNREFLYDGLLYDVSTIKHVDDEVLLTCHVDIRETKLVAKCKIQQDQQQLHVHSKTHGPAAVLYSESKNEVLANYGKNSPDFEEAAVCLKSQPIRRSDPPPEKLG